jgi:hypothetical protein
VSALKNFAVLMHMVFSNLFGKYLDVFIEHLEGEKRIMELVSAVFMELAQRVVRSVKATAIVEMKVSTPGECSTYLTWLLERVAETLSHHPSMVKKEAYYKVQKVRNLSTVAAKKQQIQAEKVEKAVVICRQAQGL